MRRLITQLFVVPALLLPAPLLWAQDAVAEEPAAAAESTEAPAEAAPTEQADPSGTWEWERTFQDNTVEMLLKLNWDGEKLTGEYTSFDNTAPIEEAEYKEGQMKFKVTRDFNGNEFVINFTGKPKANEITGTIEVDFGQGAQENEWTAKRRLTADDVVGVWTLRVETPNGNTFEPTFKITKEGDELKGTMSSNFGDQEAQSVKIEEGKLVFEISGGGDNGTFKAVYSGVPAGNKMTGKNEFDFNGNTGEWDFTAERAAE